MQIENVEKAGTAVSWGRANFRRLGDREKNTVGCLALNNLKLIICPIFIYSQQSSRKSKQRKKPRQ